MTGLAPGRGAGIQYPLTGLCIEQWRGLLGGLVLHAHQALVEAGQHLHVDRLGQANALRTQGAGHRPECAGRALLRRVMGGWQLPASSSCCACAGHSRRRRR